MKLSESQINPWRSLRPTLDAGCSRFQRKFSFGVRRSAFGVRCSLLSFCAIAFLLLGGLTARAQLSREYQLKAVFLYNFALFTEWPTNAFADDKSPIIIGIVGADPFGSVLEQTVHGENAGGHPLVVQHFPRAADIKTCHLLFIPQSETRHVEEILKILGDKPVLTVADADTPLTANVMIRFIVENNKVHFRINAAAARAANISLSSKLLRVAETTPPGRTPP